MLAALCLSLPATVATAAGLPLWRTELNGPADNFDTPEDVAADAAGDIVAVGTLVHPGSPTDGEFAVAKLSGSDGSLVWGPVELSGAPQEDDRALAVALDAAGDVYAGGWLADATTGEDFAVAKLDGATGGVLWGGPWVLAGNGNDRVQGVALDGAGGLFAVGNTTAPLPAGMAAVKLDAATGAVVWGPVVFAGSVAGSGGARALAVTADGDLVVGGRLGNLSTDNDLAVVKLDGDTGATLWGPVVLTGSDASSSDRAQAVAVDASGDVLVVGALDEPANDPDDAVLKLDGATGAVLWGPVQLGEAFDSLVAVGADAAGDVLAAGTFDDVPSVVKYDGATGAVLWGPVGFGGPSGGSTFAADLVVTSDGDAVALGQAHGGVSVDIHVARIDGGTGALEWSGPTTLDGDGFEDRAAALALLPSGDVVATGYVYNEDTLQDWVVARLPALGPECQDGLDNDGDGPVDLADGDCNGPLDLSEGTPTNACQNSEDDDGDGLIDTDDPGCDAPQDGSEKADPAGDLPCDDGEDDDGDGLVDLDDPGCNGNVLRTEDPECNDGIDNDEDGFVDYDGGLLALGYVVAPMDPECGNYAQAETERVFCEEGLGLPLGLFLMLVWVRRRAR